MFGSDLPNEKSGTDIPSKPRILIARSGVSLDVSRLAEVLREDDNDVFTMAASPVGAHSSDRSAHETLNNVDMVILVVRMGDEQHQDGPVQPYQNVIREAGVIQGRLGMDRVIFLVEEGVTGLASQEAGVPQVRFLPYTPESASNEIKAAIRATFKPAQRDLHEARSIKEQLQYDNLKAPFGLITAITLAALAFVFLLAQVSGGEDEAVRQLSNVTPALNGLDGDLSATGLEPSPPSIEQSADQAGTRRLDGGNQNLPAQCIIDVRKELVLNESVVCQGAGTLSIEGFLGPWHNEIETVAVSQGAAGTLFYESPGADTIPVALTPGSFDLDQQSARFGVQTLEFRFSAHDQHVHLYQPRERGGRVVTLVFSLS